MQLLAQFIFRLSFGLAAAMLCVSPRQVTSGYYRNNLYVLLGLNVLAALLAWTTPAESQIAVWPAVVAAVLSYAGAAAWLYERAGLGLLALAITAASSLTGAWFSQPGVADFVRSQNVVSPPAEILTNSAAGLVLWALDPICGGSVLGVTMAAMLLGHWYLNAPGMSLSPLFKLLTIMTSALLLRAGLAGVGLALRYHAAETFDLTQWLFVAMRWLTGLAGALVVALMARQTLKIPNTQSATGILYVGVLLTFVGELAAQLLSRGKAFPL